MVKLIINLGNCKKCGKSLSINGCYSCFPERNPANPNAELIVTKRINEEIKNNFELKKRKQ